MAYEVEQKYRVKDSRDISERLAMVGAVCGEPIRQVDAYFAHPARDFAQTDEALRLRRVGETNVVTYKGPKIDRATKTRREIELPLANGGLSFEQWRELLTALGFRATAEVAKTRTPYRLEIEARSLEVVLDEVDQLGSFVEIETAAEEEDLDAARDVVAKLAAELELGQPERRGYIQMLLTDGA